MRRHTGTRRAELSGQEHGVPGVCRDRRTNVWRAASIAAVCTMALLSGCGKFFAKTTGTGSSSGGTRNSGDSMYVANANTGLNSVAAFQISGSTFAKPSASPYALAVTPTTLAITPGNTFLYAGSASGAIYVYAINADGSLTIQNSANAVSTAVNPQAMVVDPSGKWLITAETSGSTTVADVFAINTSTGALATPTQLTLDSGAVGQMLFAPNGSLLYVSLGTSNGGTPVTGGVDYLSFNATTGVLALVGNLAPLQTSTNADVGLAINPAGTYLFVTETGAVIGTGANTSNGVRSFAVALNGALTEVTGSPYATGAGPGAVLVDANGAYLYVANRTSGSLLTSGPGSISQFSIASTGALTAISTAAISSVGLIPVGMVEDNSKTYVAVVCSGGSPDLEIFKFDATTPGQLDPLQSISTGSISPAAASAIVATSAQ